MEEAKERTSQKLRWVLQGPHLPASSSQLGLEASVNHPLAPRGPLSLASVHISESFPQLFFFFLSCFFFFPPIRRKSFLHNDDLCLPLQISFLKCFKDLQNYFLLEY